MDGKGGPISWPSRSPDLTPCDYFLWGYIKDRVYRDTPRTLAELKAKIETITQSITEETLQNVLKNMKMRLDFVIREKGGRFEHLLN